MHPILCELFTKLVGWMPLGSLYFILFLGLYAWWFARRQIRKEQSDGALHRGEHVGKP